MAFNVFLECPCSEFVVSGEEDRCRNEDYSCVPVDTEGLLSKERMCWSVLNCLGCSL